MRQTLDISGWSRFWRAIAYIFCDALTDPGFRRGRSCNPCCCHRTTQLHKEQQRLAMNRQLHRRPARYEYRQADHLCTPGSNCSSSRSTMPRTAWFDAPRMMTAVSSRRASIPPLLAVAVNWLVPTVVLPGFARHGSESVLVTGRRPGP